MGLAVRLLFIQGEHMAPPVSRSIHLRNNSTQRCAALRTLQPDLLHAGRRFLLSRAQFADPTSRSSESSRTQNDRGDVLATAFDVVPLWHATSVKQVYDTVLSTWRDDNHPSGSTTTHFMEVTDLNGDVDNTFYDSAATMATVGRESDASAAARGANNSGTVQQRVSLVSLVTTESPSSLLSPHQPLSRSVVAESNSVLISQFTRYAEQPAEAHQLDHLHQLQNHQDWEQGWQQQQQQLGVAGYGRAEEAIFVTDFVDSDELHPYSSDQRLRFDTTSVTMVRVYPRSTTATTTATTPITTTTTVDSRTGGGSDVVVLIRWVQLKLHAASNALGVSTERLEELSEELMGQLSRELLHSVSASSLQESSRASEP